MKNNTGLLPKGTETPPCGKSTMIPFVTQFIRKWKRWKYFSKLGAVGAIAGMVSLILTLATVIPVVCPPQKLDAKYRAAFTCFTRRQYERAAIKFEDIYKEEQQYPNVAYYFGYCLKYTGRIRKAIDVWEGVYEDQVPNRKLFLIDKADAYYACGSFRKALQFYSTYLDEKGSADLSDYWRARITACSIKYAVLDTLPDSLLWLDSLLSSKIYDCTHRIGEERQLVEFDPGNLIESSRLLEMQSILRANVAGAFYVKKQYTEAFNAYASSGTAFLREEPGNEVASMYYLRNLFVAMFYTYIDPSSDQNRVRFECLNMFRSACDSGILSANARSLALSLRYALGDTVEVKDIPSSPDYIIIPRKHFQMLRPELCPEAGCDTLIAPGMRIQDISEIQREAYALVYSHASGMTPTRRDRVP